MARRRYVVLVRKFDDVVDGATIEFRGTLEEALEQRDAIEKRWQCSARYIGWREGFKSSQRLVSVVPLRELPDYIKQNETVILLEDALRLQVEREARKGAA